MTPPIQDEINTLLSNASISEDRSPAAAFTAMKTQLTGGAVVEFLYETNRSFVVIQAVTNCAAGVEVTGGNMLKVMLDQQDVEPLRRVTGRMTLLTNTLTLRFDGQTMKVGKTSNITGDPMVRFVQPLTEEGMGNCVKLILAVFARA